MPWIGKCAECGKIVALSSGDRVKRHGYEAHKVGSGKCAGSGRLASDVAFLAPGRAMPK